MLYIYIYIYIYKLCTSSAKLSIYISKMRHLFLNVLYFGFFQTFQDSVKNDVLKDFLKFIRKYPCSSFCFNRYLGLRLHLY